MKENSENRMNFEEEGAFEEIGFENGMALEPLGYSKEVRALIEAIEDGVNRVNKDKIESLEKELKKLSSVKKNWMKLLREQLELQEEVEEIKRNARKEARKERLTELFGDRTLVLWGIGTNSVKREKCQYCNDDRMLVAQLPNGKTALVNCDCRGYIYTYYPVEFHIIKFSIDKWDRKLSVQYKLSERNMLEGDEVYHEERYVNFGDVQSVPETYEGLKYYSTNFDTQEHAQLYADWLNKKEMEA
jgi:hypothetical protein